jgi:hypothetical protein
MLGIKKCEMDSGCLTTYPFDPFHKMMSQEDIFNWLDNHLIFEDNEIIGLFHNERVLWDSKAQCVLDSN